MTIPARIHFCWIGSSLPWAYVFALLSAARRGGMAETILHHTDVLSAGPELEALKAEPRLVLSVVDPVACLARAGELAGLGDRLAALYCRMSEPVIRSDILRAAILYLQGGIYLDLDTITVRPLRPLLDAGSFVGSEFILRPGHLGESRSPAVLARRLALDLARKILRRAPQGWKPFRTIEALYFRGVNNAVMGTTAGSRLFADYLRAMAALPPGRQALRYALGPHLLQQMARQPAGSGLTIHPPRTFYPLAPEISEHWFRAVRQVRLDDVVSADTYVVHWYASIRTRSLVGRITPGYVLENRRRQLYSALVCSCLDDLPELRAAAPGR